MATCPGIKPSSDLALREACDAEYVARLSGNTRGQVEAAAGVGLRFFEVWDGGERCGFFAVMPNSQGAELHTELRIGGARALIAARRLLDTLRAEGTSLVTTYAKPENKVAKIMAAALGFRRVGVDADGTVRYGFQLS